MYDLTATVGKIQKHIDEENEIQSCLAAGALYTYGAIFSSAQSVYSHYIAMLHAPLALVAEPYKPLRSQPPLRMPDKVRNSHHSSCKHIKQSLARLVPVSTVLSRS
jgi:hypothetical protein